MLFHTSSFRWANFPAIVKNYNDNWGPCAGHWAFYGRRALAALDVNTNNHLERFNGLLKYVFMNRKKARQIAELLLKLVTVVMPHYMQDRQKKLAGLESSGTLPLPSAFTCSGSASATVACSHLPVHNMLMNVYLMLNWRRYCTNNEA
jgi:hypothetical protein